MSNKVGDVTAEELITEYGLTEEQAAKLMQELPEFCKQLAAMEKPAAGTPPAGTPPAAPGAQPPYPYPVAPAMDQFGRPYPYPYPYPQQMSQPQYILTEQQLIELFNQQNQAQAMQYPLIDETTIDIFESMTDKQIEDALNFVDRYLVSMDKYPVPTTAGMRSGAAVGYRWPSDDLARYLASLVLYGSTGMAKMKAPQKKEENPPIEKRNETFWTRVFQKRDAMDKKAANDSSAAESILPPPFFYEDEMKVDLDQVGIVIQDGVLKAPVSAAAAMVQEYTIDGKKVMVLKDPKELKAAADCARMLPITNDHPTQRIVTDQSEIKGWTDLIIFDEKNEKLRTNIEVRDEKTIKDIQEGKDNVSIGFMCDLDYTPGKFKEEAYDAVQRNIVLNHLAIVDKGRCPTGKCGIGQDSANKKSTTDTGTTMTEEELIADAVAKGCPGGEGCKCGLHKSLDAKKVEDACKKKKEKEMKDSDSKKKEGDAKMKYVLKEKDGHSHTAELDKDGNGESSKDMDHMHKIEGNTCMEAGTPPHIHVLEEVKMDQAAAPPAKAEAPADQDAKIHEGFLKEKMDAIGAIASEIAKNGSTMKQGELNSKISAMSDISWKIAELVGVIRAKGMKIDSKIIDAALKARGDTVGIEGVISGIRSRHAVLVDEVMDFNPPSNREHYAAKDNKELEEILKLLDSQSTIKLPATNDGSSAHKDDDSGSKGRNLTLALDRKAKEALGQK